ncbi:MAG TPA: efflux RND transporter periplasmic adaptor subunit [Pseudogracilibacillus sp.]|nr:efflux RND transporter periplasmic adaptor subunit [Pseudogracilibacillus sp.]
MKKKWIIASLVTAIIIIFIGLNVWNKTASSNADQVETTNLKEQEINETVMAPGKLKFADEQNVYFQEDKGEVDELLVEEGDKVEKGDKLVRYENKDIENEVKQNESQLNSDYLELENIQKQREDVKENPTENQGGEETPTEEDDPAEDDGDAAAPPEGNPDDSQENGDVQSQLDDLDLQERQKESEIEQTKREKEANEQKIADATVTSDIDGTVVAIDKDESTGAGQSDPKPMVQVGSLDSMRVEGDVSEYDALKIKEEQSVELTSDAVPDESWEGEVDVISDLPEESEGEDDDSGATYEVEAKVKDDDIELKPGFEMLMEIETANKKTEVLPIMALEQEDDTDFVYVVNDGQAERKEVQTDMTTNDVIEITDGLSDEDVVIKDSDGVEDGMEVDVE